MDKRTFQNRDRLHCARGQLQSMDSAMEAIGREDKKGFRVSENNLLILRCGIVTWGIFFER